MHMDAVSTENAKRGTYFIQKEKEVEAVISTTNEKVFQSGSVKMKLHTAN